MKTGLGYHYSKSSVDFLLFCMLPLVKNNLGILSINDSQSAANHQIYICNIILLDTFVLRYCFSTLGSFLSIYNQYFSLAPKYRLTTICSKLSMLIIY